MSGVDEKARLEEDNRVLGTELEDFQNKEQLAKISVGLKQGPVAAVVIMACNRPDYLERTLKSVTKYHKDVAEKFPLFVSQDGSNQDVMDTARSFSSVNFLQHLDENPPKTRNPGEIIAYYKIASHYKWALTQLFNKRDFRRVVILEDDMEISPDFFSYFEATAPLLDTDKTLLAISSWNDNGQEKFVSDPEQLYRSDFFPGLGWMLTKSTWEELAPKWPNAYWDDWLRLKENRKGRQVIRPEVCRTYNFGEQGSSLGQFYEQYLKSIKLNNVNVDWRSKDLNYLKKGQFNPIFNSLVSKAAIIPASQALTEANYGEGDIRVQYYSLVEFKYLAHEFGIFEDTKDGIPRTAYNGVIVFRWKGQKRVFLTNFFQQLDTIETL
uniref:Alpha-1,3-mannosyl-glycoprotein 2-beta-N-acetylglucosaminyltransferase n=1 Tax=Physcomitrium patens TaxID=3218 RepID=A0A2K1JPF3_PHYPA|nr:hypothetical protein PHYPA_015814 [Physcomitrium patens]